MSTLAPARRAAIAEQSAALPPPATSTSYLRARSAMTAGLPPHGGRGHVGPVAVAERSATAGAEIVGVSGLQARPLRNGTPVIPHSLLALARLRPTRRRVLPRFLPPVDPELE